MTRRPPLALRAVVSSVALMLAATVTDAGLLDTPLPTFADAKPAVLISTAAAIKDNAVETIVMCTNLATGAIDVGVEYFDETGALRNTVQAGDGGILGLAPGATATIASGTTAVLHEDTTTTLNGAGNALSRLQNGALRVVASDAHVGCVVLAVDRLHAIADPVSCAQCMPPAITVLPTAGACSTAGCDDANPCTIDSCDGSGGCAHTPATDGTACADGDLCTTGDACTAGTCTGTAVTCGASNPCLIDQACDHATGQCAATAARSTCIPGGGDASSDCALEWVVANPGNPGGETAATQVCQQGDGRCDIDRNTKTCTFRVRACLAAHDANLPSCTPTAVSLVTLAKPGPTGGVGVLFTAIGDLAPSTRAKKRITFDPALSATDQCTAPASITVRMGRSTTLKTKTSASGAIDKDRIQLRCVRRLSGAR